MQNNSRQSEKRDCFNDIKVANYHWYQFQYIINGFYCMHLVRISVILRELICHYFSWYREKSKHPSSCFIHGHMYNWIQQYIFKFTFLAWYCCCGLAGKLLSSWTDWSFMFAHVQHVWSQAVANLLKTLALFLLGIYCVRN